LTIQAVQIPVASFYIIGAILDTNFFTDIKQFLLAHGYVALTNDMLKAYKVAQV
jgi:hypothetical protein